MIRRSRVKGALTHRPHSERNALPPLKGSRHGITATADRVGSHGESAYNLRSRRAWTWDHRMERSEAIRRLAMGALSRLGEEARSAQLNTMMSETWDTNPCWLRIPQEVRDEFAAGKLSASPSDPRYDGVLMLWLADRYSAAANTHLQRQLELLGVHTDGLNGRPAARSPCPCCGCRTLDEPGAFDICRVCWWEDDGNDNISADVGSGSNHVSLTQARANFLSTGIFDPMREDLREFQDPAEMYECGRTFEFDEARATVIESESGWTSSAFQYVKS